MSGPFKRYVFISAGVFSVLLIFLLARYSPPYIAAVKHAADRHKPAAPAPDKVIEHPAPSPPSTGGGDSRWFNGTWDAARDSRNRMLTHDECDAAFPGLYHDIDRVVEIKKRHPVTKKEIDDIVTGVGAMKALIYDQQLFITQLGPDMKTRGFALVQALNRALVTSREPLPNVEFNFGVFDTGPDHSTWFPTRLKSESAKWLAPDFGFWSWPEPKVHSYEEVRRNAIAMEAGDPTIKGMAGGGWPWAKKKPQLVWRGASLDLPARQKLIDRTKDKPWADVSYLIWNGAEKNTAEKLLTMDEHCQYKYVSHTEGVSYSGRLKYILNCRSVIVMPPLVWLEHFHHLLVPDGPDQNFVQVKDDYSDLEEKIQWLIDHDAEAEQIAERSVKVFRDRYLSEAAETCYWRRLIRGWREVQDFEPELFVERDGKRVARGASVEDYVLLRKIEWDPY